MTIKNLPPAYHDVIFTFKTSYGIKKKRGFYCSILGTVSIPPDYQYFNGSFLPHGFGGYHFKVNDLIENDKIISWRELKYENEK